MAKITLIGMHNWLGDPLFQGVTVPQGASKDLLINTILLNYGEMETLYASPDFMQFAIKNWSGCVQYKMSRLWGTTQQEYDPIENYNRYEDSTETPNITRTGSHSETSNGSTTSNGTTSTNTSNETIGNENGNTEQTVSAFNSGSYQPQNKTANVSDTTSTDTGTAATTASTTGEENKTVEGSSTDTETGTRKYTSHTHGNIGVTTSQQMLQSERDVAQFNFYWEMAKDFAKTLLVMVY